MNPRHYPLDKQTDFTALVTVAVQVHVKPKSSESNGQLTGQRRAMDKAAGYIERVIADNAKQLSEKGINVLTQPYPNVEPDVHVSAIPFDLDWVQNPDRLFDSMYFDGRGDYSARDGAILLARLKDCFSALSGLQQGGDDEEGTLARYIENTARDIVMALTGKECQLLEKNDATGNSRD